MITEILSQLIDFVKTASPIIWEAYVRQVYVEIIPMTVLGTLLLIASAIMISVGKKVKKAENLDKDFEGASFACFAFAFLLFACGMGAFSKGAAHLLNPNYYAIQMILSQIK